MIELRNPLFCAIDTPRLDHALALARAVSGSVGGLKIGLEAFCALGPEGYRAIAGLGLPIFLDLKLHDIPNTVAGAVRALAPLSPAIINVHAAGGRAMMAAARAAAEEFGPARPRIIAVTVLTSLDDRDLAAQGIAHGLAAHAVAQAELAREAGLDGVVASPRETAAIKAACGADFLAVVPGIRPPGAASGDQKRVMTPAEALAAGADILVIGRPITAAAEPGRTAAAIAAALAA
jgi:orotidine-5'-phosphate decarboxylase